MQYGFKHMNLYKNMINELWEARINCVYDHMLRSTSFKG